MSKDQKVRSGVAFLLQFPEAYIFDFYDFLNELEVSMITLEKLFPFRLVILLVFFLVTSFEAMGLNSEILEAIQNSPKVHKVMQDLGHSPANLIPMSDELISSEQGNRAGESQYRILLVVKSGESTSNDIILRVDILNSWFSGQPQTFEVLAVDAVQSQEITSLLNEFLAPPSELKATRDSIEKALEEIEANLKRSITVWNLLRQVVEIDFHLLGNLLKSFTASEIQQVYDFMVEVDSRILKNIDRESVNISSVALAEANRLLSDGVVNVELAVIRKFLKNQRATEIFDQYFKGRMNLNEALDSTNRFMRNIQVSQQELLEVRQILGTLSTIPPWVQEVDSYIDQLNGKLDELLVMLNKIKITDDWGREVFQTVNSPNVRASVALAESASKASHFFQVKPSAIEEFMTSRVSRQMPANLNRCRTLLK